MKDCKNDSILRTPEPRSIPATTMMASIDMAIFELTTSGVQSYSLANGQTVNHLDLGKLREMRNFYAQQAAQERKGKSTFVPIDTYYREGREP